MSEEVTNALVNLDEDKTLELVKDALKTTDPLKLIEALREAMTIIGEKFDRKEYYLTDMIFAAEIFDGAIKQLEPHLQKITTEVLGKVVIGTAQGDIHDIGKNIVVSLLKCAGFEVIDLGVDVPPAKIVDTVKKVKPDIVGLSGLLTTSFEPMAKAIAYLENAGLRSSVRVMVGGGPINEEWAQKVKADAYAKDAVEAVKLAKQFCG
ncbi:MAG TPA: corrinoid protein [Candidatus Deferrimicrobium sp.]|nr:corrinoid protein [Candidatus Deferrimicrobium sp.]